MTTQFQKVIILSPKSRHCTLHLSQNISLTTCGRSLSAVAISISLSGTLSILIRLPLKLLELGLTPLITRLNAFEPCLLPLQLLMNTIFDKKLWN
jgi:hypothetical protein